MTKAAHIIASCANLTNDGAAHDIMSAVDLAIGTCTEQTVDWNDMPLGLGSTLIDFAKSVQYTSLPKERTYGDIAKAFLMFRLSKCS